MVPPMDHTHYPMAIRESQEVKKMLIAAQQKSGGNFGNEKMIKFIYKKDLKEGITMTDFIVNKAGAKIYKDINKHETLKVPVLLDEKAKGIVHKVLSVGILGEQREPIATIKKSNGESVAYRLPHDLYGWVENFMGLQLQGVDMFPAEVEFGILNNRAYAEIL